MVFYLNLQNIYIFFKLIVLMIKFPNVTNFVIFLFTFFVVLGVRDVFSSLNLLVHLNTYFIKIPTINITFSLAGINSSVTRLYVQKIFKKSLTPHQNLILYQIKSILCKYIYHHHFNTNVKIMSYLHIPHDLSTE